MRLRTVPSRRAVASALLGATLGFVAVVAACGDRGGRTTLPVDPPAPLGAGAPSLPPSEPAMSRPAYPATRRDDVVDTLHGVAVPDPYRWLENVTRDDVRAWVDEQAAFARAHLDALPDRDALRARLRELFYFDALGAPSHRQGRYFWSRKHADKEKTVVYWKQGAAGEARVLFDPNTWSTDGSVSLGGYWPSWDGKVVAYNVKANNADEAVMRLLDVATGQPLPDEIAGTKYSGASWTPDGRGFYYVWVPPVGGEVTVPNRPGFAELRFHALGTDPAKDPVIRAATRNPETFLGGYVSKDGRWPISSVQHGWNRSDVSFRDLSGKRTGWTTLAEGLPANFEVEVWKDRFYVLTNLDAPRYRVFAVDPRKPARADWKELVPQDPEATISGMSLVGGHLAVTYLRRASSELEIRTLTGALVRKVELPGKGTTGGISGLPDEDDGYFAYTSFTQPSTIFRTSIKSGAVTEYARVELPVDTSQFVTDQVSYPSKDGTPISMFVIHRKDVTPGPGHPTILYGYGGFNVSLTPEFSSGRMAWLERGGVWAVPNLRGGGEYGEQWHQDGMLLKKQNVFDDYLAAARWLIDNGWTTPDKLAVYGGSNGGLLVGAAMTQAPELFDAVVCAVPLLDMVRYHLFGSGRTWIPEYGSAEDPAQFAALHAYSPYHRVVEGVRYPALLMLAADSDDRVDPLHARKFTAAIQHATASDAPALMRVERNAGHGGADLVKQAIEMNADLFSFLLGQFADPR